MLQIRFVQVALILPECQVKDQSLLRQNRVRSTPDWGGADSTGMVALFGPEWVALIGPEYSLERLPSHNKGLGPARVHGSWGKDGSGRSP
jgi:hypothetical protein